MNSRASSLEHRLNATKDTLLLKGTEEIGYLYSINDKYRREIDTYVGAHEHKVALSALSEGKHVFVVSHERMKIVFSVFIWKERAILRSNEKLITATNKD